MGYQRGARTRTAEINRHKNGSTFGKTLLPNQFPVHPILELQLTIGNRAVQHLAQACPVFPNRCPFGGICHTCPPKIQAKLSIGQPGDQYEQEADRVADAVIRMADSASTNSVACGWRSHQSGIKRMRSECNQKLDWEPMKKENLQAKVTPDVIHKVTPELEACINAIRGGGQPLPRSERTIFEMCFDQDFSKVRVHTGALASETAREINARAFTIRHDIVFGVGQYAPFTRDGRRLMAHELAHVVQQQGGKNPLSTYKQTDLFIQMSPGIREDLHAKYKIAVERGNKEWSESDLRDLEWSLSKLTNKEAKALEGYKFLRWTMKEDRAKVDPTYMDPGKEECGLCEIDPTRKTYKISMYDKCFPAAEAKEETMAGVPIGRFRILHEIGHAMENAELRRTWEEYDKAASDYNKAVDSYNKASEPEQKKMEANIKKLDNTQKAAEKKYNAAQNHTINEFQKLIKDKPALTEYWKESPKEAFAEAFALYKVNPEGIKEYSKELFEWFSKHRHLNPLR